MEQMTGQELAALRALFPDTTEVEDQFLQKSTYERDYIKMELTDKCAFYKPIQLREIPDDDDYYYYAEGDYARMAPTVVKRNSKFKFLEMPHLVRRRFVELLAPLILYQYSKASKDTYYECLDIRGLEFKLLIFTSPSEKDGKFNAFDGHEGMRMGFLEERKDLYKFQLCHGRFMVSYTLYLKNPEYLNFVRNYKVVEIEFEEEPLADQMFVFCDTIFHPGVEHVTVSFTNIKLVKFSSHPKAHEITFKDLTKFFEYCKNVKTLSIFMDFSSTADGINFLAIKKMVEDFAATAPRLELLFMDYDFHSFQLQDKVLKRCVEKGNTWFWTDKCDIDSHDYEFYPKTNMEKELEDIPDHVMYSHYDDIVDFLDLDNN